jgi:hypothetical protein
LRVIAQQTTIAEHSLTDSQTLATRLQTRRHSLLAYRLADKDELRKVAERQRLPLPG